MILKSIAAAAIALTASIIGAAVAQADEPPPPSGDDVASFGTVGDTMLGGSLGMDGYSVSLGGTTLTSSGWPVSRTQISGPGFSYDATTDYNSSGTGEIEHWSTLQSPTLNFDNHAEGYYDGRYEQEVTINGMTYTCSQFGVCMAR